MASSPSADSSAAPKLDYCVVEQCGMRFVIDRSPDATNIDQWVALWKENHVTDVARCCQVLYPTEPLTAAGITLHQLDFADGTTPPPNIIEEWIAVVDSVFPHKRGKKVPPETKPATQNAIAVHCVAGLGRAPLFVCLALISRGMDSMKAVNFVRSKRPGAINAAQLEWLRTFKFKKGGCVIC